MQMHHFSSISRERRRPGQTHSGSSPGLPRQAGVNGGGWGAILGDRQGCAFAERPNRPSLSVGRCSQHIFIHLDYALSTKKQFQATIKPAKDV